MEVSRGGGGGRSHTTGLPKKTLEWLRAFTAEVSRPHNAQISVCVLDVWEERETALQHQPPKTVLQE